MEMKNYDPNEETPHVINDMTEENLTSSSNGKIVAGNSEYEKYNTNLNERPDYECERIFLSTTWIHTSVLIIELIFFCVLICTPDFDKPKYDNIIIIMIIMFIVSITLFVATPYSIRYNISFIKRQITYQYIPFLPHKFFCKKILNIEDAVYFREDMSRVKFTKLSIKIMKMNKNSEEVEFINFGEWVVKDSDEFRKAVFKAQKIARLLNDIVGFDINLVKQIKNAYLNKDNDLLSKISNGMDPDKKALFQNLFKKMDVKIQL